MNSTPHSDVVTDAIRIQAAAQYLPQESDPAVDRYVFAYKITMTNVGSRRARLVARHWIILDSEGRREDVKGPGVVGEYPSLTARDSYSYISYCSLKTEWGTMEGSYRMRRPDGTEFDARIGQFFLAPNVAPIASLTDA